MMPSEEAVDLWMEVNRTYTGRWPLDDSTFRYWHYLVPLYTSGKTDGVCGLLRWAHERMKWEV